MNKLRENTNANFKIHLKGIGKKNEIFNGFIGFQTLLTEFDSREIESLVCKAINSGRDKFKKQYRRGITVTLYSK